MLAYIGYSFRDEDIYICEYVKQVKDVKVTRVTEWINIISYIVPLYFQYSVTRYTRTWKTHNKTMQKLCYFYYCA